MKKEIYFAGGCFWGVEKFFSRLPGVLETQSGYANGSTLTPSYEDVCFHQTGHAETVRVVYSEERSLKTLIELFFEIIDPTAVNHQGMDRGTQYRTGIYYTALDDLPVITQTVAELQERYSAPIAVEARPLSNFYPAESYHQKYLNKNPDGYCHIPHKAFEWAKHIPLDRHHF